ncbi:NAD(P)H-binding protein [Nannocystis sp. SCPEA4]|uniref:NmrA family NAD(P)-binding protein n=1 Tax=Nannocystis sp. SCPEA4 TaxID=2996787 RepID=UPI0022711F15|nr:NAD(P)H-binding protein [Nannocystis sp. SCPEA4]MCY1059605.1 NAD(P)H-binding protein [Nannocystis sp. SCPEA4]
MTIVVTTPTGHVGSRVTRMLVQAGERPTVLARDAGRLEPGLRERVDVVEVDLLDADAVVAATRRGSTLYWVAPSIGADDPLEGYARLAATLVRAVRENAIARVVFQSSVGAEKRHGAGDIDGLAATEVALDGLGVAVTHLRCGYFFTNLLHELESLRRGVLTTAKPLDEPMPWVDPRDIGEVAAARLLSPNWTGRHVQAVHGPRDLSFAAVAQVLSEALGRRIEAVQISDDEVRSALAQTGMTEAQVEAIVGMTAGLREDFVPENPRTFATTTPTTLGSWAWEHLRPLL